MTYAGYPFSSGTSTTQDNRDILQRYSLSYPDEIPAPPIKHKNFRKVNEKELPPGKFSGKMLQKSLTKRGKNGIH